MTDPQAAAVRRFLATLRPIEQSAAWARDHAARSPSSHQEFVRQADDDWAAYEKAKAEVEAALGEAPASPWQPIESAPRGSWPDGPHDVRDPAYVEPPHLWLTLEDGQRCVGYFDAYYAEGGNAYDGEPPWVEEFSGERVRPTHWMPLPDPPATGGEAPACAHGHTSKRTGCVSCELLWRHSGLGGEAPAAPPAHVTHETP